MDSKRGCNFLTKCQLTLDKEGELGILQGRIAMLIKPHK